MYAYGVLNADLSRLVPLHPHMRLFGREFLQITKIPLCGKLVLMQGTCVVEVKYRNHGDG